MSSRNDDFWRELMGEDFPVEGEKSDRPAAPGTPPVNNQAPQPAQAPQAQPYPTQPPQSAPQTGQVPPGTGAGQPGGFTVEYVRRQPQTPPQAAPQVPPQPRPQPQPGYDAGDEPTRVIPTVDPDRGYNPGPQEPDVKIYDPRAQQNQPRPQSQQGYGQTPYPQPRREEPPEDDYGYDEDEEPQEEPPRGLFGRRRRRDRDEDFEVEFDFDEEYPDVDEKAVRRGRTKRTGCLSGILTFIFVISISVILASLGWIWATDVLGLDGGDEQVEVTVPKDLITTLVRDKEDDEGNPVLDESGQPVKEEYTLADIDAVAEELYQKGLIRYKWLFKLFSKIAHGDEKVIAGTFTLNMNYDYRALIQGMSAKSRQRSTVRLTIPEGYSITQIVNMMEENNVCGREELLDSLANTDFDYDFLDKSTLGQPKRLEGYLFPDTYEFYENDDPDAVIKRFLNNFQKKWEDPESGFEARCAELGYTRDQVLTIASMIEKEAGIDEERDSIASVIYNRLRHPDRQSTNGLLQIDATIYYVIADTGEEFSTDLDTPYNTYLYPGLPPGPIANPGLASIRAALQPADTDYYFYALGKNKAHRFFETYDKFHAFVTSDDYGG